MKIRRASEPQVLILSGLYDFSADRVALRLREMAVPFLRLNREQLSEFRITLDPTSPGLVVASQEETWEINGALRSIWFRQPVFLRNTPGLPLSLREQLVRSQWSAFLRALSVFDGAAWMNSPAATYLAESKPFQLFTASRCGFSVPRTLVSNDAERIRLTFPDRVVVKSLDTVLLTEGVDSLFTYTTTASSADLTDETTRDAPLVAQEVVSNKIDLRVTVIGDAVFPVRILSNGRGADGDWRTVAREYLTYEDATLPDSTLRSCIDITRQLGLTFSGIDLLETPSGIRFLEVNPTGEWGWLSNDARPIDATIAAWLADPPISPRH